MLLNRCVRWPLLLGEANPLSNKVLRTIQIFRHSFINPFLLGFVFRLTLFLFGLFSILDFQVLLLFQANFLWKLHECINHILSNHATFNIGNGVLEVIGLVTNCNFTFLNRLLNWFGLFLFWLFLTFCDFWTTWILGGFTSRSLLLLV